MTELLKNGATNGALNESIATGSDLIREAQAGMEKFSANAHVEGLFGLCDAFREMLERLQG